MHPLQIFEAYTWDMQQKLELYVQDAGLLSRTATLGFPCSISSRNTNKQQDLLLCVSLTLQASDSEVEQGWGNEIAMAPCQAFF